LDFEKNISMQGLRLGTSEMDRLRGSEVKNLLRDRKLVLILDLDHTLINSTRLHDISAAEMDLGIQTAASKGKLCLFAFMF
jgi:RNA polymerase II C-terminal domain phosphatase-like 3/4